MHALISTRTVLFIYSYTFFSKKIFFDNNKLSTLEKREEKKAAQKRYKL
jgi:hypothetical protein